MTDKKIIGYYLNNFRRFFTPMMKDGVGLSFMIYPYNDGVIMVGELGKNKPTRDEYKKEAASLNDAMNRTQLFVGGNEAKKEDGTLVILSKNCIIIFKDNELAQWTEDAAQQDTQKVLDIVIEKRKGNGGG